MNNPQILQIVTAAPGTVAAILDPAVSPFFDLEPVVLWALVERHDDGEDSRKIEGFIADGGGTASAEDDLTRFRGYLQANTVTEVDRRRWTAEGRELRQWERRQQEEAA